MITNLFLLPLDTLRTRHQLQLKRKVNATVNFKILNTAKSLYREEKIKGFFRGWQPRIAQSTLSPILFLGYELLKELSVSQEAKQLNSKHSFDQ